MTRLDLKFRSNSRYIVSNPDVILFTAIATAAAPNTLGYREGETHAVLIFLREEAAISPDWAKAAAELTTRGWRDVTISEAAPVSVAALDAIHPQAAASYKDALNSGFAALAFSEPVTSNDLTNR